MQLLFILGGIKIKPTKNLDRGKEVISVISYQLSVISYQLSVISYQLFS